MAAACSGKNDSGAAANQSESELRVFAATVERLVELADLLE
jgi:hypothetical protein